jgi:hypothetical protein
LSRLSSLKRPTRTATITFAAAAVGVALTVPGVALAAHSGQAVPAPPAAPTSANQIQNIDQVKTAIKAYYGDTTTTALDPYQGTTALHTFNPDGAYAHEVEGIAAGAEKYLGHHQKHNSNKAILFDVDDTTLNTYNYEIYSNFVYNPASNAAFVNAGVFPAVPGMVDLEKQAIADGYKVFFLTGRPESQRAGTVANLTNVGYTVTNSNLYLKDLTKPIYASCAPTCTTIQYKSLTRQYIESQGNDIVANFGDQYSDLTGGYADHTYKIPNPMYYLP